MATARAKKRAREKDSDAEVLLLNDVLVDMYRRRGQDMAKRLEICHVKLLRRSVSDPFHVSVALRGTRRILLYM